MTQVLSNIQDFAVTAEQVWALSKDKDTLIRWEGGNVHAELVIDVEAKSAKTIKIMGSILCVTSALKKSICWDLADLNAKKEKPIATIQWGENIQNWRLFPQKICGITATKIECHDIQGATKPFSAKSPKMIKDIWVVDERYYLLTSNALWLYQNDDWRNLVVSQFQLEKIGYLSLRDKRAFVLISTGEIQAIEWSE